MPRKPCPATKAAHGIELRCDRDEGHPKETPHVAEFGDAHVVWPNTDETPVKGKRSKR
jgi:hypothetical protein